MVKTSEEVNINTEKKVKAQSRRRWFSIIVVILLGLIFIAGIVLTIIYLLKPGSPTNTIRDIFIIFLALESLIIGVALIILIIQIASLLNLIQNEVKPILEATNETVRTLRGTTAFLSENLVSPIVKLNSTIAGMRQVFEIFGFKRK